MSDLREQLMAVRAEHGALTPTIVVNAARPKDHPLHDRFEWDNKIAGEKWRATQAAELIRSVRITYARADGTEGNVRQFHSVQHEEQQAYDPIEEIVADPIATQILLRNMKRDWDVFRARYAHLSEFVDLIIAEQKAVKAA